MNSAVCAERILQAWEGLDFTGLQSAVDFAQSSCNLDAHCSKFELERREVLVSAATQLQTLLSPAAPPSPHRLEASFSLLRHLRKSSTPTDLNAPLN